MQYEYFYGAQAEQFSFYRIPKALFTEPNFRELSTDAKVLYGILLDRMSLSLKNQWLDAQNKVYIIFTVEEIMDALNCANQKATRLMVELEKQAGQSHWYWHFARFQSGQRSVRKFLSLYSIQRGLQVR